MTRTPLPEQQEAIAALLDSAGRHTKSVPLRNTFVQRGTQRQPEPGALAGLVRSHGDRALELYLLLRASASSSPWDVTRDARVWARLLGLPTPKDDGANAVSKLWRSLDQTHHLVRRQRRGRLLEVTPLLEDGTRRPYAYPKGGKPDLYFKLPYAYWTAPQAWYRTLSLPAKAVLLIGMSLKPDFVLPTEKAPRWYGVSTDSAEKGLTELRQHGLLERRTVLKSAPLAPLGKTQEHHYALLSPFTRPASGTSRGNLTLVVTAS
jgi:hypothetical protein